MQWLSPGGCDSSTEPSQPPLLAGAVVPGRAPLCMAPHAGDCTIGLSFQYRQRGMYSEHPSLSAPSPEAILWRYMEFTKFISLLDRQELHFARADRLGDPFEGSVSLLTQRLRLLQFHGVPPETVLKVRGDITKGARQVFYVTCWHQDDYESAALWNTYSRHANGVAIETDFKSLSDSFKCYDDIYIGKIAYVDYQTDLIPEEDALLPYFHKRLEFQHEREVRAVCHVLPQAGGNVSDFYSKEYPLGEYRAVDLSTLVKRVVVAPAAEEWFVQLVRSVAARYELSAPVEESSLNTTPAW